MTYHTRLLFYLFVSVSLLGFFLILRQGAPQPHSVLVSGKQPSVLAGQSEYGDETLMWSQTDFTGGENQGPFTPPFTASGSSSGWSYYSSQTNTTIDASGIRSSDGGSAEFISSIFDVGSAGGGYAAVMNIPMSPDAVSARGANTVAGVASAPWGSDICGGRSSRYIQVKIALPAYMNTPVNNLQISKTNRDWSTGIVTDAKTGKAISGATVTINGASTKTAFNPKQNLAFGFIKSAFAASGLPNPPGGYSLLVLLGNGSFAITASASGYTSQTKTVSLTPGVCGLEIPKTNFALVKATSSTSQPTSSTPATTIMIIKVALPSSFTKPGSSTTDLNTVADLKNVQSLTLDVVGKNKIIYQEAVDLSSQSALDILGKLDQYVKAGKNGVVEVDSKTASFLNKKATIIMYNLPFTSTPKVLVDGKEKPQVVSGILYNKGTLSFTAAHFTKFEAVENKPALVQVKTNNQVVLLSGLSVLLLILVGGYLGYLFKAGRLNLGSKKKEV